jgi:serine/threonine-protein kinase HipA
MARTLDVYLHNELTGQLVQDDGGQMVFAYAEGWLNKRGTTALSQSLPLRKERFLRNECRGFFGGILPEETKREIVAQNLGISARNDYAMLEQIGGECAGAVTFLPAGEKLSEQHYGYRKLSPDELAAILREYVFRLQEHRTKSPSASKAMISLCRSAARLVPIFSNPRSSASTVSSSTKRCA